MQSPSAQQEGGRYMKKTNNTEWKVNRMFKARLFEMIFSRREELLQLYNAINGTDYQNPEELEINTLQNAIYMSMHNDISFLIDSRLSLYEHQSTYSPNLPLRFLFYVSDLYSDLTKDANLYGTKRVKIPTPKFIVFYNGVEERPDIEYLKLSDMYIREEERYALDLEAVLININPGHNEELMGMCKTLRDYSEYTERVRKYAEEESIDKAVERAITECIKEGILSEFLSKNRAEAKKMSIYEYDEEKHMRQEREASLEVGMERGRQIGIKALIRDNQEGGKTKVEIIKKLVKYFELTEEEAEVYYEKYEECS